MLDDAVASQHPLSRRAPMACMLAENLPLWRRQLLALLAGASLSGTIENARPAGGKRAIAAS